MIQPTSALAYTIFPKDHWTQIQSNNSIVRPNDEIKRGVHVVGVFPNEAVIFSLIGAMPLEQNDECAVQRARWMALDTIASLSNSPMVG